MNNLVPIEESNEARFLVQTLLEGDRKRLIITSWEDFAGKSTLCRVIASTVADLMHRPVVYADLNLRHPAPNDLFDDLRHPDLVTVRRLPPNFNSLGPYEKRAAVASIFEDAPPEALVIVDTSPLGRFNRFNVHPVNLREWVREFIIVVNAENTRRSDVMEGRRLLESQGIGILGVVVNSCPTQLEGDAVSVTQWRDFLRRGFKTGRKIGTRVPKAWERVQKVLHEIRLLWRLLRPHAHKLRDLLWKLLRQGLTQIDRKIIQVVAPKWRSGLLAWWNRLRERWTRT